MRRLFLTTTAIVILGCGASLAQVAPMPGGTSAATTPPSSTQAPTSAGAAISMPPAGSPGSALGAIQPSVPSPIPNSGVGTISECAANGTANSAGTAADFPVDATDATASASPGFDASEASPNCAATSSPPPTPGLVSPPDFANGAVPLGTTEAGGSGLSPLIAGPFPQPPPTPELPTTTCSGDATASELTSDPISMSSSC